MKCKKITSDLAKEDIREIALWYNAKSKGLGKRFTTEVRIVANYIVDFPEAFQARYDGIRVATVDIFPYCIHYFFDSNNNTIFITGVYRDSRDPEIWKERDF
jgi:plasmid stabilization system protein ParE